MSNNHQIDESKNATQDSQMSAGKNIRIGDSVFNLNFSGSYLVAVVILGLVALLFFTRNENQTINSIGEKKEEVTKDTSTQKGEESEELKRTPQSKKTIVAPSPKVYYLTVEAKESLENQAMFSIGDFLTKKKFLWTKRIPDGNNFQGLAVEVNYQKNKVNLGLKTAIQINFQIMVSLTAAKTNAVLETHSVRSPDFYVYHDQEIPKAFQRWLETSDDELIPEKWKSN